MQSTASRCSLLRYGTSAAWAMIVLAASVLPAIGDEQELPPPAPRTVDFEADVLPILASRCFDCHGPDAQEGRLRLDAKAIVLAGGVSGPALVPGRSADSLLILRIAGIGDGERMPLDADPLSPEETGLIRAWIDQGAQWPDAVGAQVARVATHWAYLKPESPALPAAAADPWVRNPIDAFILERIRTAGLEPAAEAGRERLIRRVTFDLTGLPPTLDEIDAFLADPRADAYEHLVDRLLASPRYGERWAVPWLDAARYADSNGYQRDGRRDYWAYRDWVVRAMNGDMPFDRFTIEQIAGDLLADAATSTGQEGDSSGPEAESVHAWRVATGFHRGTMANVEAGTDPEEQRVLAVLDRVNTTGTVWLGTTLECAQCHNHKYDPISQRDYYRLLAFFNSTEAEIESKGTERDFTGPSMELPQPAEDKAERERLQQEVAARQSEVDALTAELLAGETAWESELSAAAETAALPAPIRAVLAIPAEKRNAKQQKQLREHYLSGSAALTSLRKNLEELQQALASLTPPSTLVMQEMAEPRITRLFKRGDFLNPGETVEPGTPSVLHPFPADVPPNRLGLARWLASEENPLVARVTVNRWWAEFFGRGLVVTLEDFGAQGEPPTHPELLDWLATEFMHRGWSMKAVHRLIVTSAAYRQSARLTPELLQSDPDNSLYARGPRLRLGAEFVRDAALAVSGLLSGKMHGPPVFPYQPAGVWNHIGRTSNEWTTSSGEDLYRRGLYVYWRRTVPYPSFVSFDAPTRETCSVARSQSSTPLQALTLMNDPAYFEMACALAGRLLAETSLGATDEERAAVGFRLATSRHPQPAEIAVLVERCRAERARYAADPARATKFAERWKAPADTSPVEFAVWAHVASVLLNLDEAISR